MHIAWKMSLFAAVVRAALPWVGSDALSYCAPLKRDSCAPEAFVRAQDLAPHSVAHGELRVRLPETCKVSIQSVSLSLALEEYAHVRLPRSGGRLRWDSWLGHGGHFGTGAGKYETTTRTAWNTETMLVEHPLEKELRDIVRPFSVVTPNVNYPPATLSETHNSHDNDSESFLQTWSAYRYMARVMLSNGKTHNVPAGFTTFHPVDAAGGHGTADEKSEERVVVATLMKDGPWDSPAPPEIPFLGRRHPTPKNISATMEVAFPNGATVAQGESLHLRIRLLSHTISEDYLVPGTGHLHVPLHLGGIFTPSRPGFLHTPAPPILRASLTPQEPYRRPDEPIVLSLPLSGDFVEVQLKAPETLAPDFNAAFGRFEGTIMLGVQVPQLWCDADDGWSIRRCESAFSPWEEHGLQALVPVRIISSGSAAAASTPAGEPTSYISETALTLAPVIVSGHSATSRILNFPSVEPRLETTTKTEENFEPVRAPWDLWDARVVERECGYAQGRDMYDFEGPELGLVERSYAGMLWARRYGAEQGGAKRIQEGGPGGPELIVQS
ncbi:hypothetical protein EXIGLDRAFT_830563 [Exidia glandulosa HHB12029]|uniref:Arrestin-like N-terminal domain-containing protein n=1 Tax=Exidia glandulosa HHB12029 TaxID=1314781 RepID=A0A165NFH5_EXIGL|nr:hypothetical protein EXIGLDRAFT_830563 [Exidia glandulosa HHB12029]